jgi:hypothetical protein
VQNADGRDGLAELLRADGLDAAQAADVLAGVQPLPLPAAQLDRDCLPPPAVLADHLVPWSMTLTADTTTGTQGGVITERGLPLAATVLAIGLATVAVEAQSEVAARQRLTPGRRQGPRRDVPRETPAQPGEVQEF